MLQVEPAPDTVAIPVASPAPRKALTLVVTVPPLNTFRAPLPPKNWSMPSPTPVMPSTVTAPPFSTVSVPVPPTMPMPKLCATVNCEPAPVTTALPIEPAPPPIPSGTSGLPPVVVTLPPSAIVNMPVPGWIVPEASTNPPTNRPPVLVHIEPGPEIVATPKPLLRKGATSPLLGPPPMTLPPLVVKLAALRTFKEPPLSTMNGPAIEPAPFTMPPLATVTGPAIDPVPVSVPPPFTVTEVSPREPFTTNVPPEIVVASV